MAVEAYENPAAPAEEPAAGGVPRSRELRGAHPHDSGGAFPGAAHSPGAGAAAAVLAVESAPLLAAPMPDAPLAPLSEGDPDLLPPSTAAIWQPS